MFPEILNPMPTRKLVDFISNPFTKINIFAFCDQVPFWVYFKRHWARKKKNASTNTNSAARKYRPNRKVVAKSTNHGIKTFKTSHQKCQRPRQTIPNIASKSIQNSQKSWNRCPSENLSISYQILLQKSIFLHFATKCPSGFILSATARDNGLISF